MHLFPRAVEIFLDHDKIFMGVLSGKISILNSIGIPNSSIHLTFRYIRNILISNKLFNIKIMLVCSLNNLHTYKNKIEPAAAQFETILNHINIIIMTLRLKIDVLSS